MDPGCGVQCRRDKNYIRIQNRRLYAGGELHYSLWYSYRAHFGGFRYSGIGRNGVKWHFRGNDYAVPYIYIRVHGFRI
ncbi:hypothetical protein KML24004_22260 [Alistipes indistinctus]